MTRLPSKTNRIPHDEWHRARPFASGASIGHSWTLHRASFWAPSVPLCSILAECQVPQQWLTKVNFWLAAWWTMPPSASCTSKVSSNHRSGMQLDRHTTKPYAASFLHQQTTVALMYRAQTGWCISTGSKGHGAALRRDAFAPHGRANERYKAPSLQVAITRVAAVLLYSVALH
jgi:hypothetical protein